MKDVLLQDTNERCTSPKCGINQARGNKGSKLRRKVKLSFRCPRAEGLERKSPNWSPNQVPGKKRELSLSKTFNSIENCLQRAFAVSLEKLSDRNRETFKGNKKTKLTIRKAKSCTRNDTW